MKRRFLSFTYRILARAQRRLMYLQAVVMAAAFKDAIEQAHAEADAGKGMVNAGDSFVMGKDEYERMCASMVWGTGQGPKA